MSVRALVALAVVAVLAPALSACGGADQVAPSAVTPAVAGGAGGGASGARPEFRGTREVGLRRGHQAVLLRTCAPEPGAHRLCQADGRHSYAAYGAVRTATVTGAAMRPARDHTSWVVRMRFDQGSTGALAASARRAEATEEFVLLLDGRQRVLAAVDPHAVEASEVQVGPVTKPEAWALVSALAQP